MVKTVLPLLLFVLSFQISLAQEKCLSTKSNINRLYVDLEVKGNKLPDTLKFNKINLDNFEKFRLPNQRMEVLDNNSGYVLILFSQIEAEINRAAKWPLRKSKRASNKQYKANF